MTVSYEGLWRLLFSKQMNRQNLVDDLKISSATIAKMGRGEMVNGKIIDKICEYLECEAKEIVEIK